MEKIPQLLDVFETFMMPRTTIDQYQEKGKPLLFDKMSQFVNKNKPIEFVMLGFPFKSTNIRDKVIGIKPDMGEELTLSNFKRFDREIRKIHEPGVVINMVSDGYVFNDLLGVDDKIVQEYKEISMDFAKTGPVKFYDLNDFYSSSSLQTKRSKVIEQFGVDETHLEREILINPDVNFLYKGMIRFMSEELAMLPYNSGNQLHKAAKKLARDMMFRNEAYSNLVRSEFSDKIRISMHPSVNSGAKYSFQLINSPKAQHSAWHCAIVVHENNEVETIHRKEAEAKGYEMVTVNGTAHHFLAK